MLKNTATTNVHTLPHNPGQVIQLDGSNAIGSLKYEFKVANTQKHIN